ncbi:MAG: hypothetical protein R8K21_09355 [Mariprofundales bacterium]
MQIQVTWKNGALYPTHPLQLRHNTITVDIPEEEIAAKTMNNILPANLENEATAMLRKFELIRSQLISSEMIEHPWTLKQQERMEAFELRSQLREDQGRAS